MFDSRIKTLVLGIGFAFLGAGCESFPEYYKGAMELPKPEVSVASTAVHQINFNGGELSDGEKAALQEFIYREGIQYGDELSFDFAPGDEAVWYKKAALDNYLKTIGVWVDGVTQTGGNTDPSSVTFVMTRYKATTPDCYALSRESFVPTELEKNKIFGCITVNNLAAHVANKKDLMEGRPDTRPVATASARAIELYRASFGVPIVPTSSTGSLSSSGSTGFND